VVWLGNQPFHRRLSSDSLNQDSKIRIFINHCVISTRETIWKYLQLILFSIVGTLDSKEAFGDTAKLFEAINADDFKDKLQETLSQMQDLFNMAGSSGDEECPELTPNINMDNLPKAEDIHEHINGMLDGQLGKLAKEIAEETAANLNIDMENSLLEIYLHFHKAHL
jgi:hypothetical protein